MQVNASYNDYLLSCILFELVMLDCKVMDTVQKSKLKTVSFKNF